MIVTDNSFRKVLESAVGVSLITSEESCNRSQYEGSLFLVKNCLSGLTIHRILYSNPIRQLPKIGPDSNASDFPTAYVIVRTMFETYLNMHYVLIEPKSDAEKEHRLDMWYVHGFSEILRMGKPLGIAEDRLQHVKESKTTLKTKILSSDYFMSLSKPEQDSIRTTDKWKKDKDKIILATECGFHQSHAEFIYSFLSNYAHSEAYSLMQIGAVKSSQHSEGLLHQLPKIYTEMLLALTLNGFAELFNPARDEINKDPDLLKIINFWEGAKGTDFSNLTEETGKIGA